MRSGWKELDMAWSPASASLVLFLVAVAGIAGAFLAHRALSIWSARRRAP
jgi:hypothetical protein